MTNPDVESHVRAVLRSVAATTVIEDRWPEVTAPPGSPPNRKRSPLLVATAGFILTLVIVGVSTLVPSLLDRAPDRDVAIHPLPAGRYPIAQYLPDGFAPVSRSPIEQIASTTPLATTVVLANESGRSPTITGIALVSFLQTTWHPQPEERRIEHQGREIVLQEFGGRDSAVMVWSQGGVVVMLHGWELELADALAVVEGVSVISDDPTAPGSVNVRAPDGMTVISGPEVVEVVPDSWLTLSPSDTWSDTGVPMVDVQVMSSSVENSVGQHASAEPLTIRGRHGYVATREDVRSVIWQEEAGMTVSVRGRNIAGDELIKVAEGLAFVDIGRWHSQYSDVDDGTNGESEDRSDPFDHPAD